MKRVSIERGGGRRGRGGGEGKGEIHLLLTPREESLTLLLICREATLTLGSAPIDFRKQTPPLFLVGLESSHIYPSHLLFLGISRGDHNIVRLDGVLMEIW